MGFDAEAEAIRLDVSLTNLPTPPGGFAQAGSWFFLDESHYVKLVTLSRSSGEYSIQLHYELDNNTEEELETGAVLTGSDDVVLPLKLDPVNDEVTALYSINGGSEQTLGTISVDPSLFSGTSLPDGSGDVSFAGIFATHRNASEQVFTFDDFDLSPLSTST